MKIEGPAARLTIFDCEDDVPGGVSALLGTGLCGALTNR